MGRAIIIPKVNFQDAGLGRVTLSGNIPVRLISINGPSNYAGETLQLSINYAPLNTTERAITWSIVSGNAYASISNNGIITIDPSASSQQVIVQAEVAGTDVSAIKSIILTYSGGGGGGDVPDYEIEETYDTAAAQTTDVLRSNTSVNSDFIAVVDMSIQSYVSDARIFGYVSSASPWVGVTSGLLPNAGVTPYVALVDNSIVHPNPAYRVSIDMLQVFAIKVEGNDVSVTTDGTNWTEWLGVEDMSGANKFEYGRGIVGSIKVRLFNDLNIDVSQFFE